MFIVPLNNGSLSVFRSNGQVVWEHFPRGAPPSVADVAWKPNGSMVAVVFSNGSLQYFSADTHQHIYTNSNRVVNVGAGDANQTHTSSVQGIEWRGLDATTMKKKLFEQTKQFSVEIRSAVIDHMEPLKQMPCPTHIPNGTPASEIGPNFWRASLVEDDTFSEIKQRNLEKDDEFDVSAIIYDTGVELCISGIFPLPLLRWEDLTSSTVWQNQDKIKKMVTFSTDLSHCLISQFSPTAFSLHTFDLHELISPSVRELIMLAIQTKSALDYASTMVKKVCTNIETVDQAMRSFFGKSNLPVDEFIQTLFDYLIRNTTEPPVLEWIKNAHEKGFKIWFEKVGSCYDKSKQAVLTSIIPVCERLCVLMSKIRGRLTYDRDMGRTCFTSLPSLNKAIDAVSRMLLLADRALWAINKENIQFKGFSKWIGKCFEVALSRPIMPRNQETVDTVKTLNVCDYLTNYLLHGHIEEILGAKTSSNSLDQNQETLVSLMDQIPRLFDAVYCDIQEMLGQKIQPTKSVETVMTGTGSIVDFDIKGSTKNGNEFNLAVLQHQQGSSSSEDDTSILQLITMNPVHGARGGSLLVPPHTKCAKLLDEPRAVTLRPKLSGKPNSPAIVDVINTSLVCKNPITDKDPSLASPQKDMQTSTISMESRELDVSAGSLYVSSDIEGHYYSCVLSANSHKFAVWRISAKSDNDAGPSD